MNQQMILELTEFDFVRKTVQKFTCPICGNEYSIQSNGVQKSVYLNCHGADDNGCGYAGIVELEDE